LRAERHRTHRLIKPRTNMSKLLLQYHLKLCFSCKSPASRAELSLTLYKFACRWLMLEHVYLSTNSTAFEALSPCFSRSIAWVADKSRSCLGRGPMNIIQPQLARFFILFYINWHIHCLFPNTWHNQKFGGFPVDGPVVNTEHKLSI
jgi:hypothetical protein